MKEKPTDGSPFFGEFLLTASLRRRRMSMFISLFTDLPESKRVDEVVVEENGAAVKNNFKLYQQIPGNV